MSVPNVKSCCAQLAREKTVYVTSGLAFALIILYSFPIVTVCLIQMLSIRNSVVTVGSDSAMPE